MDASESLGGLIAQIPVLSEPLTQQVLAGSLNLHL